MYKVKRGISVTNYN